MNPDRHPFVSIVVPCRNEQDYIAKCLDSVVANDYPKDRMEVLVVDGASTDTTREIAARYAARYGYIRIVDNPKKILASAWNIGITDGRGDIIMCLNAHGVFTPDYVSKCVRYLEEYGADYVGGVIDTVPRGAGFMEKSIARALSHPFGVGNSYFRIGTDKPIWADTAAFGGYRKEVFLKAGLYNEELTRSQDMEFHLRMKKTGAKILLAPDMRCTYYTRSDFRNFLRDSFVNGYWTIYPLAYSRIAVSLRHIVPGIFVASIAGTLVLSMIDRVFLWFFIAIIGLYAAVNLFFSVTISFKEKNPRYAVSMPVCFALLHFLYGFGTCYAACKVLVSKMLKNETS